MEEKLKAPKRLPYLKNRWDRLDEYHQLSSEVTKEEFVEWWGALFRKFKITTFEKAKSLQPYQLLGFAKVNDVNYYGTFEQDFYGGMFGCMGLYGQSFYNDFLPESIFRNFYKKYPKVDNAKDRFNFIKQMVDDIYE